MEIGTDCISTCSCKSNYHTINDHDGHSDKDNQVITTNVFQFNNIYRAHPHIVKTGRLDFSLSRLKGEVRENLGDFRKSIQILTFLSPLPHVVLPFTKTNNDLKRMQLTSLE